LSHCDKPSKFTRSECHNFGWTDNPSTLRRNVTVVKCHSRRFVGWTDSVGQHVAWLVCGWTDRQCTFKPLSHTGGWRGEYTLTYKLKKTHILIPLTGFKCHSMTKTYRLQSVSPFLSVTLEGEDASAPHGGQIGALRPPIFYTILTQLIARQIYE
jgi:hypothetical protein